MRQDSTRVVVTGLGAVTSLGLDKDSLWAGLLSGQRGLRTLTKFNPAGLRNDQVGQICDWTFAPEQFVLPEMPDEATQFLLTAIAEAVADADLRERLGPQAKPNHRAGAALATNFGGSLSWEEYMGSLLAGSPSPQTFAKFRFYQALHYLTEAFPIAGPCSVLCMACASGTAAVGQAYETYAQSKLT